MLKKSNTNELLIRIDERVKYIPAIQQDIKEIKEMVGKHETRISIIEEEHKKPFSSGLFGALINLFLRK